MEIFKNYKKSSFVIIHPHTKLLLQWN